MRDLFTLALVCAKLPEPSFWRPFGVSDHFLLILEIRPFTRAFLFPQIDRPCLGKKGSKVEKMLFIYATSRLSGQHVSQKGVIWPHPGSRGAPPALWRCRSRPSVAWAFESLDVRGSVRHSPAGSTQREVPSKKVLTHKSVYSFRTVRDHAG